MMLVPRIEQILLEEKLSGNPITREQLAKELGVSVQMISLYVRGKAYPQADKLFKLARILNRKVDDLYYWVDVDEKKEP